MKFKDQINLKEEILLNFLFLKPKNDNAQY